MSAPASKSRWVILGICAALLLAFLLVSWQYDPAQRKLRADPSIMLYVGQQILRGNPPYKTVTIVKTPVTGLLAAAAIGAGRVVGWNDVFAARAGFMVIGGLLVVVTFLLGARLWAGSAFRQDTGSTPVGEATNERAGWQAGLFAALALLGMDGIAQRVTDGPSPKVPFILFGMAALWLAARRNWFLAGAAGALSFLTWQPGLVYVGVVWLAVFLNARGEWKRALSRSVAGALTPLLIVGLYLASQGALNSALKQTLGANASYFGAAKVGAGILTVLGTNATELARSTSGCFSNEQLYLILGAAGLIGMTGVALWQASRGKRAMLCLYAPLLLSAGALGAFTLLDFQSCADLLPFFPYLAVGLGWLAAGTIALAAARLQMGSRFPLAASAVVCAVLLVYGLSDVGRAGSGDPLEQQRTMAAGVAARLDGDDKIQQFGDAVLLVLLQKENATRFIHLGDKQGAGILRAEGIDPAQLPDLLAAERPRVITLSRAKDQPWAAPLYTWIEQNYAKVEGYDAQSGGTPQVTEIYLLNEY